MKILGGGSFAMILLQSLITLSCACESSRYHLLGAWACTCTTLDTQFARLVVSMSALIGQSARREVVVL